MKMILAVILVLALLLTCAVGSVLLARGWFTLRTGSSAPAAPPIEVVVPSDATPTLAAILPPAQPAPIGGATAGGFNGTFAGTLNGDNGSTAPATLSLTQTGNAVTGQLNIGQGLVLDAGNCGLQAVPSGIQNAAGTIDPAAPNHLQTTGSIPVSGFTIGVTLSADLAADGQSLAARADLDLPGLCGRDPAIGGTFTKQ